jgi:peptidoglycan/xylan/chitin deacetylase (PgdA/CDA1 family)
MNAAGIPVLMYHALAEARSVISVSPDLFAQQMAWLHRQQYRAVSLAQMLDYRQAGQPLPERLVVVTFDDGFESVYRHAFPVLTKYNFSATVFLVSDYCGQTNNWPHQPAVVPQFSLLNWSQIREMDGAGIEFGGHTATHPWLDRLSETALEQEIVQSKLALENKLGHSIRTFSYPYGRFTPAVKKIVSRHYQGACTTRLAVAGQNDDPLALPRIEALYITQTFLFRGMFSTWFPTYLSARRLARTAGGRLYKRAWV